MRLSWLWSYCSLIYNYLCNQCLSPLRLWVWIPLRGSVFDTTINDKVCQWLATGRWFSPGTLVSSTNKTDPHDITEILLKVALKTITLTPNHKKIQLKCINYVTKWLYRWKQIFIVCHSHWIFFLTHLWIWLKRNNFKNVTKSCQNQTVWIGLKQTTKHMIWLKDIMKLSVNREESG